MLYYDNLAHTHHAVLRLAGRVFEGTGESYAEAMGYAFDRAYREGLIR